MGILTPSVSAELCRLTYEIKKPDSRGRYRITASNDLKSHFIFDLSNGPIKATSGGVVSHMKGNETGFVLVGKGVTTVGRSNPFKNDLVFAIRGTDAASDWSSDFRTSICVSDSGKTVHSGFNAIFEMIKGPLAKHVEQMKPGGVLHCVGHSLGGALALMVADWVKSSYSCEVKLYSFGAPKVGYTDFSLSATNRIGVKNIYRCVNGGDVVPMVPVWPFVHVPYNAAEYCLDNNKLINPLQHKMVRYSRNCKGKNWESINKEVGFHSNKRVVLSVRQASQVQPSIFWMNRLSEGLLTLLNDTKHGAAQVLQSAVANGLNLYDKIAMILSEGALGSPSLAGAATGLLACMLKFSGYTGVKVKDLSYSFIRWVFEQTLKMVYRLARTALSLVD
ncbi:lipase family protein [Marinomonas spartinae]|uniref:lipase family protein n=1 Tax=Marinomonas spartinae TaxID=1792290 RepID=UPI0018F24C8F|nr:lipase family protein [Marinomonas spartinae]MBJ7554092.1 lipase family protein [Marinomonas spartinae]